MSLVFSSRSFDELDIVNCLSLGDVLYIEHEDVNGIHYMVVLNSSPESDSYIVLGVLTTKIEKRKKFLELTGKDPRSLVEFDYIKHSAVDCNSLKEIPKDLLREKLKKPNYKVGKPLPEAVIKQIIEAVLIGDAPQRLKNMVKNQNSMDK